MTRALSILIENEDLGDIEDYRTAIDSLKSLSVHTNWPFSSGERIRVLDRLLSHSITKVYTAPFMELEQFKLELLQRMGESQRFEILHQATGGEDIVFRRGCAFIFDIDENRLGEDSRSVSFILREAYQRILDSADILQDTHRGSLWSVDNGGGAVNIDSERVEGTGSVSLNGVIAGATESRLRLDPPTYFDSTAYKWAAFWFRTDNVIDLTELRVRYYIDGSNYMSFDFTNTFDEAGGDIDTWYFIRIPRSSFTETGTFDWTETRYVVWSKEHSSIQTYKYLIDMPCLIE